MASTPIFISYRRDDTAGYARALCDALAARFGADRVFMDVEDIVAGHPFADVLRRAVDGAAVTLVLIGPRWRGERPGQAARIDDLHDFVRLEVAAALAGGGRVIPLLIDGTPMPTHAQLPPDLQALAERNALELGNARFGADLERLVAALRDEVPGATPPASRRIGVALLALAAVVLVAGAALWLRSARGGAGSPPPAASAAAASRPAIDGEWEAQVRYDWPNADYVERFSFGGEGDSLHGSASFLRVPRGVLEGSVAADGLRFFTRTADMSGGAGLVHRYRARLVGDELRFTLQTEGGTSAHGPVEFVARRAPPASATGAGEKRNRIGR
ncbi:MAG: toll/interleukin-1 receptor domain-containing protein [Pseudomonadota bacterium]